MARRGRGRSSSGSRDKLQGLLLSGLGACLLGLLVAGAIWLKSSRPETDKETNCPLSGPTAAHVIMIDQSDPISGQQAQEVRNYLTSVFRNARFGTRIDIYTFEGNSSDVLKPKTRLCAPKRPADGSEWTENLEYLKRDYENKFSKVVLAAVDGLLQAKSLPTSPLMESIRAASITSLSDLKLPADRLDMTFVSDMVQHSSNFSQISSNVPFEALAKTAGWPSLQPKLRGATVRVLYLLRPRAVRAGKPIQDRGHQMFWEKFFQASDGHVVSIEPL